MSTFCIEPKKKWSRQAPSLVNIAAELKLLTHYHLIVNRSLLIHQILIISLKPSIFGFAINVPGWPSFRYDFLRFGVIIMYHPVFVASNSSIFFVVFKVHFICKIAFRHLLASVQAAHDFLWRWLPVLLVSQAHLAFVLSRALLVLDVKIATFGEFEPLKIQCSR